MPVTENVVIDFSADIKDLQPAVDILEKLGAIDKKNADDFRKNNADFAARTKALAEVSKAEKALSDDTAKAERSMEGLSLATKEVANSITSGGLDDATQAVMLGIEDAFREAGVSVEDFSTAFKKKGNELIQANQATGKSIQDLRREYRELLSQADAAGGAQTKAGRAILKQAGEIKDQIGDLMAASKAFGSDTATFDGVIQGLNGVAAGYQIAQGTQALFGTESKELQETLVKLQAIMAVTNGLQQIQNLLQKESAFILNVVTPLQRLWTTAIGETTGAVRIFRTVLASLGIGLIAVGIYELITNFDKLKSAFGFTNKEIERYKAVTAQINAVNQEATGKFTEESSRINLLTKEYGNANISQQRRKEILEELKQLNPAYFGGLDSEKTKYEDLQKAAQGYIKVLEAKTKVEAYTNEIVKQEVEISKLRNSNIEDNVDLLDQLFVQSKVFTSQEEKRNELLQLGAKNLRGQIDEKLELKKVTTDLLNQELKGLSDIEAQNAKAGLGNGDAKDGKSPSKSDANKILLEEEKAFIERKLLLVKEGTEDEITLRKELIDTQKKIDLSSVDSTQINQRKLIEEKANQEKLKLDAEFSDKQKKESDERLRKLATDEVEIRKATIEQKLALTKSESDQELTLKKQLLQAEAEAAVINEDDSGDSEELRAAKIKLIRANLTRDLSDLDQQYLDQKAEQRQNEIDEEQRKNDQILENNRRLNESIISNAQVISDTIFTINSNNEQDNTTSKLKELERRRTHELNSKNLTENQKSKIDEKYRKEEAAIKKDAFQKEKNAAIIQAGINGALAVMNALATVQPFYPAAILAAAAAAILTGAQVAIIASKPTPQFRYGVEYLTGPGTTTSDSIDTRLSVGERVVSAETNQMYYPALTAIHNRKVSPEVANKIFTEIPQAIIDFRASMPSGYSFSEKDTREVTKMFIQGEKIDYDKLGKVIASEMEDSNYELIYTIRQNNTKPELEKIAEQLSQAKEDPYRR